ncbi:hypothetical protein Efla_003233 [Eimeria flavescens]
MAAEEAALPSSSAFGCLAIGYLEACERSSRTPHSLLFRRLHAASAPHASGGPVDLVCLGREKEAFLQRLTDEDLLLLLQSLHAAKAELRSVDLSFNCLHEQTGLILASFPKVTCSLQSLSLRSNLLGPEGTERLCAVLPSCAPSLSALDLSLNKMGKKGGKAVARMLARAEKLRFLNVSDCEIDLEGIVHITTAAQDENKSLEALNLSNPAVSFNSEHAFHIGGLLKLAANLTQLELSKQELRDDGVEILLPYLLANKTLRRLGLACNQITWRGAAALSRLLAASTPLEFLELTCNQLRDFGAETLAAGIGSNTNLRVLLLNRNGIGRKGLIKLADALSLNCELEALAISQNSFDSMSLLAFAKMENHFMRCEPLVFDFLIYYADGQPHAAPNGAHPLLLQKAAEPPAPFSSSLPPASHTDTRLPNDADTPTG